MCGIAGSFRLDGGPADLGPVRAMRAALEHRGPDDAGDWTSGPAALGFRRLSILDLSGGHQPMSLPEAELTIVFNGEIYNHPELKAELEAAGTRYRTRSDTETLLHLYRARGREAFGRLEGMFAVGLFDGRAGELVLARDGVGVKPLYYAVVDGVLYFASELRALAAGGVPLELDAAGVLDYLRFGFVRAPRTALKAVRKLPPGHLLIAGRSGVRVEKFWELAVPERPDESLGLAEATAELERLLRASVRGQLLSDVPVGAFLSGGVDSSLIAALMTQESGARLKTFSIGFSGARAGLDESGQARAVARQLGTDHHELVLPATVLDRLEDLAQALDEPVADSAILPTLLLARFAREQVKVVLTGEGADELFAGYGRYKAAYLSERVSGLPGWSRGAAAAAARRMGRGRLFDELPLATVRDWAEANAHSTPAEAGAVLRPEVVSAAAAPTRGAAGAAPESWLGDETAPHTLARALAYDLRTILCDALLMKADKTTMRASLEARVPYLDRRLLDFAFRLPPGLKIRRLKGKYILRTLAERWLPKAIAWRRKHGFLVPWEEWVRRPGNPLIDDLIRSPQAAEVFDAARLRGMREQLCSGARGGNPGLFFRVAVFLIWRRTLSFAVKN